MSENFIEKLKSKFPALAGKQNTKKTLDVDDSDISSSDGTENIDLDKIDNSNENEKKEGSDSASKIRSIIIYLVVAAGVGYYAFDEYIVKPNAMKEAQAEAEMMEKLKNRKNKKLSNIKAVAEESKNAQGISTEASPSIDQVPGTPPDIKEKPEEPSEKKMDTSEKHQSDSMPVQPKTPDSADTPQATEEKKIIEENTIDLESAKVQEEVAKIENSLPKKEEKKQDVKKEKAHLEKEVPPESSTSLSPTDAAAVEVEYVSPPEYANLGRGLVYNCKEKYWACVGKEAFIQCKKNNLYNQQNNKTIECSSVDVYQSTVDCQKMQLYKINKVTNTDFCK